MTEIYMTAEFARFQLSVSTPAGLFLFAVMNGGDYDTVRWPCFYYLPLFFTISIGRTSWMWTCYSSSTHIK